MRNTRRHYGSVVFIVCFSPFAGHAWAGTGCDFSNAFSINNVVDDMRCGVSAAFTINNVTGASSCGVSTVFRINNTELPDADTDGTPDLLDNCPSAFNPLQEDSNSDGIGDACEPPVIPPSPNDARKNRYITFAPGNAATPVNFQVTHAVSGKKKWVVAPTAGLEALNLVARLTGDGTPGTMPATRVWNEPVIHATDCMIVPVNSYEVRATTDGVVFSAPLVVDTIAKPGAKFWADTNGPISGGAFSGPNGLVDFIDINAAVQRFQNTATAPPLTWVDINPQMVDVILNFADINRIVQGFQGQTYPFLQPAACP